MSDPIPEKTPSEQPEEKTATQKSARSRFCDLVVKILLPIIVLLLACRLFGLLRPFSIPNRAMAPTIERGDHLLMEGASYWFRAPRRGDLLVFETKGWSKQISNQIFVKRVIGVPGDTLAMVDGKLHLNGVPFVITNTHGHNIAITNSPYVRMNKEITIPENEYFAIGDNAHNSVDSLYFGAVPNDNVLGRMVFRYWPLSRIGFVR